MRGLRNSFFVSQLRAIVIIALVLLTDISGYQQVGWHIIATVFMLYLPGYRISLYFFKRGELSWIERVCMSFAISLALVVLAKGYTIAFDLSVSTMQIIALCWLIIVASFIGLLVSKP